MSNEENASKSKETAKKAISSLVSSLSQLKEANPKVLYGGIGVVVLAVLFLMMGGDDKPELAEPSVTNLVIGQNYKLREVNSYDPSSEVRLVVTPGNMAAFDDTEKEDREGCNTVKQGTPVRLLGFYDAFGKQNAYANIEVLEGECKGKRRWILSINVQ